MDDEWVGNSAGVERIIEARVLAQHWKAVAYIIISIVGAMQLYYMIWERPKILDQIRRCHIQ